MSNGRAKVSPTGLIIVGAGGFGREAADVAVAMNTESKSVPTWNILGIFDDSPSTDNLIRIQNRGIKYLGPLPNKLTSRSLTEAKFVVGVGDPVTRHLLSRKMKAMGLQPATLVHPQAGVGTQSKLGPGTVVCAGAQVSTNVQIGEHVHINPNATVGHDTYIDNFVSVNPGAIVSGEVTIGAFSLIGAGSTILQRKDIGASVIVGAGACVVRDVPAETVVVGIPAKKIKDTGVT